MARLIALCKTKHVPILLCAILVLSVVSIRSAAETVSRYLAVAVKTTPTGPYTAQEMLRDCSWVLGEWETDEQAATGLHCAAYVAGVTDGASITQDTYRQRFNTQKLFCLPRSGLEEGQVVKTVLQWLENHPERLQDSARAVIVQVLHNSFSCGR